MNFATWSIRNPIPAIVLFALLTLAGLWGFRNLPVQDFPDIQFPAVSVTLTLPGGGSLMIEGSRIPGEFVNWCRSGGQVQRAQAAEQAEEAEAAAAPDSGPSSAPPAR